MNDLPRYVKKDSSGVPGPPGFIWHASFPLKKIIKARLGIQVTWIPNPVGRCLLLWNVPGSCGGWRGSWSSARPAPIASNEGNTDTDTGTGALQHI